MGIQGMELCAMAVVVLLFIAVLKQFGILEPMSMEGNMWPPAPLWFFPGRQGVGRRIAALAQTPPPPGWGGQGFGLRGQRELGLNRANNRTAALA